MTNWKTHEIQQLNGQAERIKLPAKFQIATENWTGRWKEEWNQVAVVPYIVYIPEKDRIIMMASCGNPHQAVILTSDDRGTTWSEPRYMHTDETGKSDTGFGMGFTYMGRGKAFFYTSDYEDGTTTQWITDDYEQTWSKGLSPLPSKIWPWDPGMVDIDPTTGEMMRVWGTANGEGDIIPGEEDSPVRKSQAYLLSSTDDGRTWSDLLKVPQWAGANEVALIRAKNGDMVAACRTDIPDKFESQLDHGCGMGVSISTDEGRTWSKVKMLYEWGRHHPSMVLLPSGDIVMTYVARKGYVDTPKGYPQYGVEAILSHDNGRTWDLDHKYIFATWAGNRTDAMWSWIRSSQQTSSVLLPDGSILTAFGTGYRGDALKGKEQNFNPRDVGLVNWRVNDEGLNDDTTIANAPFDSDLRNRFVP